VSDPLASNSSRPLPVLVFVWGEIVA